MRSRRPEAKAISSARRGGVLRGAQAGHQRALVAVLLGAVLAVDAHFAPAGAHAARAGGGGGAARWGRTGARTGSARGATFFGPGGGFGAGQGFAADRAAIDEAVVAAEGGHGCVGNSVEEGRRGRPRFARRGAARRVLTALRRRQQPCAGALGAGAALDRDVAQVVVEVDLDGVALGGDVALGHRGLV